jgi:nucleotide-binding universal stress UspA family protein
MFQRILIAYDGGPESQSALREGANLARALGADVVILGLCILDPSILIAEASAPSGLPERMAEEFREDLEAEAAGLRESGLAAQVHCTESDTAETICAATRETKSDLLVVGHRHRSALRNLFDTSTERSILEHLPCSLLVIGQDK